MEGPGFRKNGVVPIQKKTEGPGCIKMECPRFRKMEDHGFRENGMVPKLEKTTGLDAKEMQILDSVISGGRYGHFVILHAVLVGSCGSS